MPSYSQTAESAINISISLPDGLIYSHQEAVVRSCVNVGLWRLCNVLIFISIMYFSAREQSVCPLSRDRLCEMNSAARFAVLSLCLFSSSRSLVLAFLFHPPSLLLPITPSVLPPSVALPCLLCQKVTPKLFAVSFRCTVTASDKARRHKPAGLLSCSYSDVNDKAQKLLDAAGSAALKPFDDHR